MTFQYTILPAQRLILVRFGGNVSDREFVSSAATICADARYGRGFDGLIDVTDISADVTIAEIRKLVDFTLSKRKHGHGRWAVLVTTPTETAYAMMYQKAVAHEHPFSLFCTWEAASDFLGSKVDAESFDAVLVDGEEMGRR